MPDSRRRMALGNTWLLYLRKQSWRGSSLFFLCQIFYVPAITLLKASVGLFLLRISVRNVHIWSIRITIIATGLFGLYFFIVTVLQCRSLSNYWTVERKKCISFSVLEYSSYVWSALNAAADWTFGLLPAFIIRDLQMSRQNKAIISGVLGFAAIGSAATIVRIPYLRSHGCPK